MKNPMLFIGTDPRHLGRVQVGGAMVGYDRIDSCWRVDGSRKKVKAAVVATALGASEAELRDWENAIDAEFEREIGSEFD